jgi:glutamate/tyrosine decarboxylase-like PLP-dependent enzyme
MYIEMTTYAIPTFLIKLITVIAAALVVWFVLVILGTALYSYMTARAIEKQMKIDAEIDRLHK